MCRMCLMFATTFCSEDNINNVQNLCITFLMLRDSMYRCCKKINMHFEIILYCYLKIDASVSIAIMK